MKLIDFNKRVFDFILAFLLLLIFMLPMLFIGLLVKVTSYGPAIYSSIRIGRKNQPFEMPKFRSMLIDTPQVATDRLVDAHKYLTPIGHFLRKSSLDELPQLWSILVGDMSFVGPRPALFNQDELVHMRTKLGIDFLRPGLTGWAQINGRDELSNEDKVQFDLEYKNSQSLFFDLRIMGLTFVRVFFQEGISH